MSWKAYWSSRKGRTRLPMTSSKSSAISRLMMHTAFSNPARLASNREKSMITWPSLSTGSICFKPPYRLPMPAAMMTRMGLFISNTSKLILYVMCCSACS